MNYRGRYPGGAGRAAYSPPGRTAALALVALAAALMILSGTTGLPAEGSAWPFSRRTPVQPQDVKSSPLLADIDGDGNLEMLCGDGNYLRCLNADGSERWSVNLGSWVGSSPAAWDVNGDGRMEVFVGAEDGFLYGFDYRGNALSQWGWPKKTYLDSHGDKPRGVFSSPAIGDITGDGKMEIVVGSWGELIWAWTYTGEVVGGFPVDVRDTIWSSPALGDVNGDGRSEVVIGVDCSGWMFPIGGLIYVLDGEGRSLPGWPLHVPQVVWSSPALADLTGDGYLDIVVGTGHYWKEPDARYIYGWDYQGNSLPGWPVSTASYVFSSPAIGDVTGDGRLEVVAIDLNQWTYVVAADGNVISKTKSAGVEFGSPVLGDSDGDGKVDVVYDFQNAPALGDMDGSGTVDIAYNCRIVKTEAQYNPGKFPWPMFGRDSRRTACVGASSPEYPSRFYFAEGYTGDGFRQYLCIGNRNKHPAGVELEFMFPGGETRLETLTLPPGSRATVDVNQVVGPGREVSTMVRSRERGLVVERPMYFNYRGNWPGGTDVVGTTTASDRWYFAEGTTLPGFEQYFTVQNPGDEAARLTFNYMMEDASRPVFTETVAPRSRATFRALDHIGAGRNASLLLGSDRFVVAERLMYFNYRGRWTGGHCVMGATSPAKEWYFAEGTTREGFEEYLCIQNPNTEPMTVVLEVISGDGQGEPITRSYRVPDRRRLTVDMNQVAGPGKDISVSLKSDYAFVAERAMYFNYQDSVTGGHILMGANRAKDSWFFAEGYTGPGFDEWICIQNPGEIPADIEITYYPEQGSALTTSHRVPAGSRHTVSVNRDAGSNLSLSAQVDSSVPVICERSMYFRYDNAWPGGHVVMGF